MKNQQINRASKHLYFRDNWLLCSGQRFWEIVAATIEDLAFGIRSSREPDGVGRRVCLSGASYGDAEKSEWRMALKI
jgi:integrase